MWVVTIICIMNKLIIIGLIFSIAGLSWCYNQMKVPVIENKNWNSLSKEWWFWPNTPNPNLVSDKEPTEINK